MSVRTASIPAALLSATPRQGTMRAHCQLKVNRKDKRRVLLSLFFIWTSLISEESRLLLWSLNNRRDAAVQAGTRSEVLLARFLVCFSGVARSRASRYAGGRIRAINAPVQPIAQFSNRAEHAFVLRLGESSAVCYCSARLPSEALMKPIPRSITEISTLPSLCLRECSRLELRLLAVRGSHAYCPLPTSG